MFQTITYHCHSMTGMEHNECEGMGCTHKQVALSDQYSNCHSNTGTCRNKLCEHLWISVYFVKNKIAVMVHNIQHTQLASNIVSYNVWFADANCLAQNIHKCSQILMLISTCLLPRTFTNVHKSYFHMSLAQNIHKCSQILLPHVSCPEHSQIFINPISTCLLPRTFTNIHKSYFHMSLAQNIHKSS